LKAGEVADVPATRLVPGRTPRPRIGTAARIPGSPAVVKVAHTAMSASLHGRPNAREILIGNAIGEATGTAIEIGEERKSGTRKGSTSGIEKEIVAAEIRNVREAASETGTRKEIVIAATRNATGRTKETRIAVAIPLLRLLLHPQTNGDYLRDRIPRGTVVNTATRLWANDEGVLMTTPSERPSARLVKTVIMKTGACATRTRSGIVIMIGLGSLTGGGKIVIRLKVMANCRLWIRKSQTTSASQMDLPLHPRSLPLRPVRCRPLMVEVAKVMAHLDVIAVGETQPQGLLSTRRPDLQQIRPLEPI